MAIITKTEARKTIQAKTKSDSDKAKPGEWWNAPSKREMANQLIATAAYLKQLNQYRYRQDSIFARLYGNMPLYGFAGTNLSRMSTKNVLPSNRPTMSVITSCIDTLVAKMTQSRPRPVFLTDNGDYKERKLATQMNSFVAGELYQTQAYQLGEYTLRDSGIFGTGVVKIVETLEKRVGIERRLASQILVDSNETFMGPPRQLYEMQLVDRHVLAEMFPEDESTISKAEQSYVDQSSDSTETVSDQVMVVEGWRLPSYPGANDGLHVIACSSGHIKDVGYTKKKAPFEFLYYSPPVVGFWGQGLAERQMGTQNAINQLLKTIHESINLVGVPRVFVEDGSKVVKAHLNNQVGSIVTYRGTKPVYEVAPCNAPELYQELNRLKESAYEQEGISELASTSQKPAGLNSGAALREYNDIQSDRFAALSRRYDNFYVDLSYAIIDKAKDICERDGKYQTVYPDRHGSKQVDLPKSKLLDDPFVIQCYDSSSLPRDPAGRLQKVTEMMQSGIVTPQEGRRLLDFPDIEQEDKLANAPEERILQILDEIVEEKKYTPPDPFMDLQMANTKVVQYINLYGSLNLEEDRMELLRNFFSQLQLMLNPPMPPQMPGGPMPPMGGQGVQPQANPQPPPQSELIQNVPGPM